MSDNVLVVAAHPDDEILGCGGAVARHASQGDTITSVILAEGATSRADAGQDEVDRLKDAARRAAEVLGATPPINLGFPDNQLDSLPLLNVIQSIEEIIFDSRPSVVYVHHGGDLNIDHRIAHEAVITACRPIPGSPVRKILTYETVSSTEWSGPAIGPAFRPTTFIDIAGHMETKLAALDAYQTEMRPFPHVRSMEAVTALATLRGSQAGLVAAEAFQLELEISPFET